MAKYLPSIRKEAQLNEDCDKFAPGESLQGVEVVHDQNCDWSTPDLDTENETDDPPTRYYFAAYLAPEIYGEPSEVNQYIDSWGLGYITVEMVLGYGM
uniref:Protein kinase domain-containing protein n=1 Tax=Mesocestoides corti TaxID=53468 RepID=A0A5K3F7K0_MESCO